MRVLQSRDGVVSRINRQRLLVSEASFKDRLQGSRIGEPSKIGEGGGKARFSERTKACGERIVASAMAMDNVVRPMQGQTLVVTLCQESA